MAFVSGLQIGKYELGRKLGEGGFGVVFQARDTGLDRDVALKFMHPEHIANAEILRRFLQEARSAAKIIHPGIVTVFECGQVSGTRSAADGVAFIAMELLHGESLSDRVAKAKRLSVEDAIEIIWQVASALEAAHNAGIIHRDLKPDNIFICKDPAMPNGERVKVLDFGIAKLAQAPGSGVSTRTHMVMGTPPYMSPEQCRSATQIDHRSDIYTLGCILFELVCGKPPFDGEAGELIAKHQMVAPPTARSLAPELPAALDSLINAMLAKQPGDRPQTMSAVQRALGEAGPIPAGLAAANGPDPATSLPRFTPPAMRAQSEPGRPRTPPRGVPAVHGHATILAGQNQAPHTTLGGSAGQVSGGRPKSRAGLYAVLGLALAGIGGAGIYVATRGDSKANAPEQAAMQPAPTPPPPTPTPPPPPPPAAAKVTIELDSTPQAEVFTIDGRSLGPTPYKTERMPDEGKIVFVLKANGYQDQRVDMAADKSDVRKVELAPIPRPPEPVAAKPVARPKPKDKPKPAPPKPAEPPRTLRPGDIVIE